MEEYKIIEGFENYSVSNFGNVKSNETNKLLKQYYNKNGYKQVELYANNKRHTKGVHRLVLKAFTPNPDNKPVADHINNIRDDNRIENLRWATYTENCYNRSIPSNNTSGYKGISYDKRTGFWRVKINADGKLKDRTFETIEKAIIFRQSMALKFFGDYVNKCEDKTDDIIVKIPKNRKVKITLEVEPESNLEELEKEFMDLLK